MGQSSHRLNTSIDTSTYDTSILSGAYIYKYYKIYFQKINSLFFLWSVLVEIL